MTQHFTRRETSRSDANGGRHRTQAAASRAPKKTALVRPSAPATAEPVDLQQQLDAANARVAELEARLAAVSDRLSWVADRLQALIEEGG
jgi:TolA-binding protein